MGELREVRMRPRQAEHDVAFKRRVVTKLLADGASVRLRYMLRAREAQHAIIVRDVLVELGVFIEPLACEVVAEPRSNTRSVEVTIAPAGTPPPDGAGARVPRKPRPPVIPTGTRSSSNSPREVGSVR